MREWSDSNASAFDFPPQAANGAPQAIVRRRGLPLVQDAANLVAGNYLASRSARRSRMSNSVDVISIAHLQSRHRVMRRSTAAVRQRCSLLRGLRTFAFCAAPPRCVPPVLRDRRVGEIIVGACVQPRTQSSCAPRAVSIMTGTEERRRSCVSTSNPSSRAHNVEKDEIKLLIDCTCQAVAPL